MVRTVFGKRDYRAEPLTVLYKRLKWLKIKDTRNYHDIISLEAMLKFSTPWSISSKFNITHTHRHNTRYTRNRFRLTNETTSFNIVCSSSFVCRSARLWVDLPNEITLTAPPRWIFKDYVRSGIGGWEWKDETSDFIWWN